MPDLRFDVDSPPSFMERAMAAAPRVLLGLFFVVIGLSKFDPSSAWVRLFERIGIGTWFRYVTGAMQIAGGLLALFPRTAMIGAAIIGCTMAGAVVTDLFVLRLGPAAIIPFVLLAFAVGVGLQAWANRG